MYFKKKLMAISKQHYFPNYELLAPLLIIFFTSFSSSLFTPVLVRILSQPHEFLSIDSSEIVRNFLLAISMSVSSMISIFATSILGSFSDRWGRKQLLTISLSITLISLLLPIIGILFHTFTLIFLGSSLMGFNICNRVIAKTSIVDISKGTQRKLFLGWTTLALNLASSIASFVGGFISNPQHCSWFSVQTPYYLGLFIVGLNLLILLFFFREPVHSYEANLIKPTANIIRLWLDVKKEPQLIKPLAAFFFFEYAFALYINDIPLFWHGFLHTSVEKMSCYSAFTSGVTALSLLLVYPFWIKHAPKKYQLTFPILGMSISLSLLSLFSWPIGRWLLTIPIAFFAAISYPQLLAMLTTCVSEEKNGWLMGVIYSIVGLVWFSSALLMVSINALSPHLPLLLTGALALFCYSILRQYDYDTSMKHQHTFS